MNGSRLTSLMKTGRREVKELRTNDVTIKHKLG